MTPIYFCTVQIQKKTFAIVNINMAKLHEWFIGNMLSLNFDKTYTVHTWRPPYWSPCSLQIMY